jgi:hypothetical protein
MGIYNIYISTKSFKANKVENLTEEDTKGPKRKMKEDNKED